MYRGCLSSVKPVTGEAKRDCDDVSDPFAAADSPEEFLRGVWPGLVRLDRFLTGSQQAGEER